MQRHCRDCCDCRDYEGCARVCVLGDALGRVGVCIG